MSTPGAHSFPSRGWSQPCTPVGDTPPPAVAAAAPRSQGGAAKIRKLTFDLEGEGAKGSKAAVEAGSSMPSLTSVTAGKMGKGQGAPTSAGQASGALLTAASAAGAGGDSGGGVKSRSFLSGGGPLSSLPSATLAVSQRVRHSTCSMHMKRSERSDYTAHGGVVTCLKNEVPCLSICVHAWCLLFYIAATLAACFLPELL
jgi:hypothetical protein